MNIAKIILLVAAGALTVSMMCTADKTVDIPPTPTESSAIGTWDLSIPPIPGATLDTLNINLRIKTDSLFNLELTKLPSTTLYRSEGTWKSTSDSIFLISSKCLVLDTVPDPDSLKNLADSLCKLPIPLKLPVADTLKIETRNLTGMLSGFPVPKATLDLLPLILKSLSLVKNPAD